jgi:hypothetical protein
MDGGRMTFLVLPDGWINEKNNWKKLVPKEKKRESQLNITKMCMFFRL